MPDIKKEVTRSLFEERENDIKHPTFEKEMAFYNLIGDGKTEEVRADWVSAPRSNDAIRGILSDNPIRNAMYHFVAMTSIVTRVCISKGMPQDVAFKLSDAYIRKADRQPRLEDIENVQWEMVKAFSEYMASSVRDGLKSKQIVQCIDYIRQNIHNNITVAEMAEHVMLNETYLSKLFKKEVGCTVSEYIRNEKIEEACWLLLYTDKTSIEISTDLSFSSHSYFISVFKKVKGVTPKEFRNNNYRQLS